MIITLKEEQKLLQDPKVVWEICKGLLAAEDYIDREKEHLWVFHLDTRNKIKLLELVSLGILNSSLVHPREVFRRAVVEGVNAIIVAHNHPSNCSDPSEDDINVTKRLKNAGDILGIEVVDHVVVCESGFTSLRAKNVL